MTRPTAHPALLFVPPTTGTTIRFRVVTPDGHPVAVTADPALAAATALAVARHHEDRYAAIAASDGWSETMAAVATGDGARVASLADALADDHDDTLYAAYAGLAAARVAIENGDLDAARARARRAIWRQFAGERSTMRATSS